MGQKTVLHVLMKTTGVRERLEHYTEKKNDLRWVGLMGRTIFPVEMQAAELEGL